MATDQRALVLSDTPTDPFADLSRDRKRQLFFASSGTARASLVADLSREQLREFVRRLAPDEATDVLGFLFFPGLAQIVLVQGVPSQLSRRRAFPAVQVTGLVPTVRGAERTASTTIHDSR